MPIEYLMWSPLVAVSLALYVTLAAGAFFSLANSGWVPLTQRRVWTAVVILLPVAGAVLWLAASHRHNVAFPDDIAFPDAALPDDITISNESAVPEHVALPDDRTGPAETVS